MLVELRDAGSGTLLNRIQLDDPPHPGSWFEWDGTSFLIMQRQHRYSLKGGTYQLSTIALVVKPQSRPSDAKSWRHGWVIGDPTCRFNALSPLLRCAVGIATHCTDGVLAHA